MDKQTSAILRLQEASEMSERLYDKPLLVAYSGGKDSDVLVHLADAAGIDYEVKHSLTTVDAPETVRHIRKVLHRLEDDGIKCTVDTHRKPGGGAVTMWNLIPKKLMPPTRMVRYCCDALKEAGGASTFVALGTRWAESVRRSNRKTFEVLARKKSDRVGVMSMDNEEDREIFESCPIKRERTVSPIIDWSDQEMWDYIESEKIEMNPLYECGFERVGCIGCPVARLPKRKREFELWPKYKENYIRAFDRMLEAREAKGKETEWKTGEEVFRWWMGDKF